MEEAIIRIGGAAGDGVASTGDTLARTCSRSGLHVNAYSSYQSVIRGGHVWFNVRCSSQRVRTQGDWIDILIALNLDTVKEHAPGVRKDGYIVYNEEKFKLGPDLLPPGVTAGPLPATKMGSQFGKNPIMQNTVALGAAAAIIGLKFDILAEMLRDTFGDKVPEVVKANVGAAQAGYEYSEKNFVTMDCQLAISSKRRYLITGNQAIALGALAAGCRFYSAYPMTPASTILHWMASHASKYGILVKQAEDEIAVINMAIGASIAGVRAMCGTSGGGFSLMVEGVGLAGMTETPIVIVESQRAGPSTGLPTKTEQGDLNMVLGASQGDFPRIIVAPRNVEECFHATMEAFNLAERYQTPAIILTDFFLSEQYSTLDDLKIMVPIDRGLIAREGDGEPYLRYRLTETGVSPRAIPGQEGNMFVAGSDEHREDGAIISDVLAGLRDSIKTRQLMMEKRMKKQEYARQDMKLPEVYGPEEADLTLIGWGSTQGVLRETCDQLLDQGLVVNTLEFRDIWPLRTNEVTALLKRCKRTLMVECNYTGQMARLIRAETGFQVDHRLLKYNGEPLYTREVVGKVKEVLAYA